MNTIPIAFAFDNRMVMPASVTITSLLQNANKDTFYDIFVLYPEKETLDVVLFAKISDSFHRCRLNYIPVGDTFSDALVIRGISTPTYYRLLIPRIIPQYDKIIYADADMIFRMDLNEVYSKDLKDSYLAATLDIGMNFSEDGRKYIETIPEVKIGSYLQAGFLLINSALIRKDCLVDRFIEVALKGLRFQDQDALNIVCHDRVTFLQPQYNMTDYSFVYGLKNPELWTTFFSREEFKEGAKNGNLHYNGHKPWLKYSLNFDIWWEYYRKSPIYDEKYYFDFFYRRMDVLDTLSLWKRLKVVARYFTVGRK